MPIQASIDEIIYFMYSYRKQNNLSFLDKKRFFGCLDVDNGDDFLYVYFAI